MLKFKTPYQDIGAKAYDQHVKDREVAHLRKKAAQLGYALTATDARRRGVVHAFSAWHTPGV